MRILKSSTRRSANSCLEAYQRLRQSSMIPTRNPVGRTFCPMSQSSSRRVLVSDDCSRPTGPAWPLGQSSEIFLLQRALAAALPGRQVGKPDVDVCRAAADQVGHAAGPGHQPLEHRAAVASGVDHDQLADSANALVFGVGHGDFQHLLDHASTAVRHVFEDVERHRRHNGRGSGPEAAAASAPRSGRSGASRDIGLVKAHGRGLEAYSVRG